MSSASILRGFRVSVATLDRYLKANGIQGTAGIPPSYRKHPDQDKISVLLYSKILEAGGTADKIGFRVLMPSRQGSDPSSVAYITYAWVTIYAHRALHLSEDLPEEVPKGFEELRQEFLSFHKEVSEYDEISNDGKMGLYLVYTDEPFGMYIPQAKQDRIKVPQFCDQCDMTFNDERYAFAYRQQHRIEVHGSTQTLNPLPEA